MQYKKRGISPVVATSMLVMLAVILAVIIFFWARSVLSEKIQKNLGGENAVNIEQACEVIQFKTDATIPNKIAIENIGNVPIHGVKVFKTSGGSRTEVGSGTVTDSPNAVLAGQYKDITISTISGNLAAGDELLIVPVLVGTIGSTTEQKQYVCDDKFGVTTKVA